MKVALVCPYAWDRPGGVQSHVRGLAAILASRGHDVRVLAPAATKIGSSESVTIVGRAIPIPANGSMAPLSFGPLAAARLRRALDDLAADVVHAHEPLIPSLSLLAVWTARAPVVGTFHASADSSLGYAAARPFLERAARRLAARTAVSDAARSLIVRYFPGEYALTPNGIDRASFEGARPLDLGNGPVILFFGRIERRKGLEVLVQAMTRLRGEARLVVGGDGPERAHCEDLARRLQVDATFLGRVEEVDKTRLYASADVYCAPGLGGESFGIVLVEAMAAGVPVVCSDLGGFRAVAGDSAEYATPGEPGSLSDALRAVLADTDRRKKMTAFGAQIARSFDWARIAPGVEDVYERARQSSLEGAES